MKRTIKLVGLDIGFGFTKAFDGTAPCILRSLVADGGRPEDATSQPPKAPYGTDGCCVIKDQWAYYIGDLAVQVDPGPQEAFQPERLFADFGQILALAALAVYSTEETPLQVVAGLPFSYFGRLKTDLEKRLIGYHKIFLVDADGGRRTHNIHIRKLHAVPNPMGTFAGLALDVDGRLRDRRHHGRKVAVVDIGYRTTDILVMEDMRLNHRSSATIPIGIKRSFDLLSRRLQKLSGVMPTFGQLYQGVRLGMINIDGQAYDMAALRAEAFERLTWQLKDAILHVLSAAWDLDELLLTGGATRELADLLAPALPGEVTLVENELDPRLNNAQGQLRLARFMWGASGLCENRLWT
jgi:plasmid segregation protein ParM